MANDTISNSKIYELLNAMRLELKGDIRDLRNQFDTLEAGRLTRLESSFRDFQVEAARTKAIEKTLSNKFLAVQGVAMILLAAAASAFFLWVFGGTGGK